MKILMSSLSQSLLCRKKTETFVFIAILFFSCFLFLVYPVFAADMPDQKTQWQARLTPVPLSFTNRAKITGIGQAEAKLRESTLTITASFKGLQGAATNAKLHLGPKAISGPAIVDLDVVKEGDGKQGKIVAEIKLSPEQIKALHNESLYIQLASDVAEDGNLRGWLLPSKK